MPLDPLRDVNTLLVPVDGSEGAFKALAVACDIARRTRARVSAMYVIEVPRSLPLDADLGDEIDRGDAILQRAEQIAKEHHVEVRGELLQARQAAHALVDEASEMGADAIVMGVDYHQPLGTFQLGAVPQHVLANAPCEVWLLRYPLSAPRTRTDAEGDRASRARRP